MIVGLVIVALIGYGIIDVDCLIVLFFVGVGIAFLRMHGYKLRVTEWMLQNFERPSNLERKPGVSSLFYIAGMILVLAFFEQNIALAAIIVLSVGDSISCIVGRKFGRVKHPFSDVKFIEGHLVGGLFAALLCLVFVSPLQAFLGSYVAMFLEGVDRLFNIDPVDDNVVVPLAAAIVMALL